MRFVRTGFALFVTLALGACSSESSTNPGGGGSGTGGSSTGGSATGGTAGASTGGSSTGGMAGSSGGTGGTAGSASGGAAGGGGVNPGCDPLCTSIVAANCNNGPTKSGCLLTCKALTSSAKCDTTADAYFNCVKGTTVTCNGLGDPVATGCGLDYLKAINCATTENPNPAIVTPCSDYCDKVVAQACPNNGTKDECNSNCKWLGATGTGCSTEWATFLTCANSATFTCLLGYASAQGCGTQFKAYTDCVKAAGQ